MFSDLLKLIFDLKMFVLLIQSNKIAYYFAKSVNKKIVLKLN